MWIFQPKSYSNSKADQEQAKKWQDEHLKILMQKEGDQEWAKLLAKIKIVEPETMDETNHVVTAGENGAKTVTFGGGKSIASLGFEQAKDLANNDPATFGYTSEAHVHFCLRWLQAIETENQLVFDSIFNRVPRNMHTSKFFIDLT